MDEDEDEDEDEDQDKDEDEYENEDEDEDENDSLLTSDSLFQKNDYRRTNRRTHPLIEMPGSI